MNESLSPDPLATAVERDRTLLEINNAIISNLTREPLFHAIADALHRVRPVRAERDLPP